MPLLLHVDGDRWRAHLRDVATNEPGLVPVAKGNGYGLGLGRLARRAEWLGSDVLAVGQYEELEHVATRFPGDMVVLTPYRAELPSVHDSRVIHTIGRADDLAALREQEARSRVLLELRTSMLRHGFTAEGLREVGRGLDGVKVEGVSMHFPLGPGNLAEARQLLDVVVGAEVPTKRIWVSHLSNDEIGQLRAAWPDLEFRNRIGTQLWLGDRAALRPRASVLDVHPIAKGGVYGYRRRHAGRSGTVLVVSGGTAHGIGLEAPTGDLSVRSRARTVVRSGLASTGRVRSPYFIGGQQAAFAEPPHMQSSMIFLPDGVPVPQVGDEIPLQVRFTTTTFDDVLID